MSLNLQRIAWAVLIASFIAFCVLVTVSALSLYNFLFKSTVPLAIYAEVSRGSLGITGADLREDVERGSRVISVGNFVRPNEQDSQGVIALRDPQMDDLFVGSVALIGATTSTAVRSAERPRFEWGTSGYMATFGSAQGRFEVILAGGLPRSAELILRSTQGTQVRIRQAGRFEIEFRDETVTVFSHGGTASLIPPAQSVEYVITAGSGSEYSLPTGDLRALVPTFNLIQNSSFEDVMLQSDRNAPLNWACNHTNVEVNAPRGTFTVQQQDGRSVLRMARTGGALSNGETICQQGLARGEVWQDISQYETLNLIVELNIAYQSLPVCGFVGSECPLMVRIDYIDAKGELGELIFGFYSLPGPPERYAQTCESCRVPHMRLREKSWYTFDSGNLLAGFPADLRPVAISRIRFYASGHEYDTRVSRLELTAGNVNP
ncbi:MAG: hypothetical protein IT298_03360 [Chloroflexi bacterium]|nr:MAG: hypothetical protein UZ13_02354 [Chloroflexi bacterium OLB13]MBV6435531.1 hypothetical protein [Anaerolineae bacterium]MCC6564775.1 hypothetical protein [Chloroflexota bacterium]MDL1914533.1 hypothetical protein [Anaerolineae bacterium CFX4]MBW7878131.1 hypothetical protein [Anaerolineae bacterium]